VSWKNKWEEFKSALSEKREVIWNKQDGLKANQAVKAIYESSKNNYTVFLELNN
jgi:predicted dehydrogenase